jgi:putative addiction module killer protein
METKKLVLYRTLNGQVPFQDWLESLTDRQTRARIRTRLKKVVFNYFGDFKNLGGGLFELRFHFGPGYRIYFGQDGDIFIILLCGGDKSSQGSDILTAFEYWLDYKRRKP